MNRFSSRKTTSGLRAYQKQGFAPSLTHDVCPHPQRGLRLYERSVNRPKTRCSIGTRATTKSPRKIGAWQFSLIKTGGTHDSARYITSGNSPVAWRCNPRHLRHCPRRSVGRSLRAHFKKREYAAALGWRLCSGLESTAYRSEERPSA